MLGLLITIVGLVVCWGRGMIGRGMVDSMVDPMVGNWGMVNSMVSNNRGSMNCMMDSRSCVMDGVATKSCERNSGSSSHKWDKSN